MNERVGKRESPFDPVFFEIDSRSSEGPTAPRPLGDKQAIEKQLRRQGASAYVAPPPRDQNPKEAIQQALRDQGAGAYVDGPRLKTAKEVLVDLFSKKPPSRAQGQATTGTASWGSVAKQHSLGLRFQKLEERHEKLTRKMEGAIFEWQAAKQKIASSEKDPAARTQKLAYADGAIGRLRSQLRETRIQFGILEHEYKVAMGLTKEAAFAPAKPGDRILSPAELSDLQKRTMTFEKRMATLKESGVIAPVAAFLYAVLTEAGGRSLDARDYRALDTIYAIGKLGNDAMNVPGEALDSQYKYAPDQKAIQDGVRFDAGVPTEARAR